MNVESCFATNAEKPGAALSNSFLRYRASSLPKTALAANNKTSAAAS